MGPGRMSDALRELARGLESPRPARTATAARVRALLASLSRSASLSPSPSLIPPEGFEIAGSDLPEMFHAGQRLYEAVTTEDFFEGWYGWGFYAAFDPEYVRRWYGPVVTRLRAAPAAKVLLAAVDPSLAHPGLVEKVLAREEASIDDGPKFEEMRGFILENQTMWVHAVDRLAIEEYDAVVYSDEQVVFKDPGSVECLGEVPEEGPG